MSTLSPPEIAGTAGTSGNDRQLVRVQAISGSIFALFLLAHLINQMLAALGPAVYDGAQRLMRRGYQAPVLEIVLVLAPLFIHAGAGVLRMLRRRARGQRTPTYLGARLHRISGIVLLIFFAGHVFATRGASFLYNVFPEFAGIAFTLRWVPAYFFPYYTVFAIAGLYHSVYGLGIALPMLGIKSLAPLRRPRLLVPLAGLGSLLLILGMLGFGGVLFDVGQPEQSPYARLLVRLGVAHVPAPAAPVSR